MDIWALGVITFAMLTSSYPFDGRNKKEVQMKVKSKSTKPNYSWLDRFWRSGTLVKDFLAGCLDKDPSKRLTAE